MGYERDEAMRQQEATEEMIRMRRPDPPPRRRIVTEQACRTCAELAQGGFGPSHDASPRCESGKRPHCTCDICF